MTPAAEQAALQHALLTWVTRSVYRRARYVGWVIVAAVVSTALFDPFALDQGRAATALGMRALAVAAVLVILWLTRDLDLARVRPWPITVVVGTGLSAYLGASMATLGDLNGPWLMSTCFLPLWLGAFPVRFGARLLAGVLAVAANWGAAVWVRPDLFDSEVAVVVLGYIAFGFGISMFISEVLASNARGAFVDRWLRERREASLAAANEALAEANAELESRVQARTEALTRALSALEDARSDERRAVAGLLHDDLGQQLTALRITTSADEDPLLAARVAALQEGLDRALGRLAPQPLTVMGLCRAIKHLADELCKATSIQIRAELDPGLDALAAPLQLDAYRALREGLNNAVRHASASRITLKGRCADGDLHLDILDNGCGIASPAPTGRGLGLAGIADRARRRGGSSSIRPLADGGSHLRVRIPLESK